MKIHCLAHVKWPLQDLILPFPASKLGSVTQPDIDVEPRSHVTVHSDPQTDEVYTGQLWNGQRDGIGTSLSSNGNAYSGEWCSGRRHGWGFMVRKGGIRYEGTWCGNQVYGFGVLIQLNDSKYMGEFANFQKHGSGVSVHPNGYLTVGQWKCGAVLNRSFVFQSSGGGCAVVPPGGGGGTGGESAAVAEKLGCSFIDEEELSSSSSTFLPPLTTGDQFLPLEVAPLSPPRWPSTSSSSSSSSDWRNFQQAKSKSNVIAIHSWTPQDIAYLFTACGVRPDVANLFVQHHVSGQEIFAMAAESLNDNLKEMGIANPYIRRYMAVIISLILRIRRRCLIDMAGTSGLRTPSPVRSFTDPGPTCAISPDLLLDVRQIYVEKRIGGGGYGKVYKGKCDLIKSSTPGYPRGRPCLSGGSKSESDSGPITPNGPSCAIKIFRCKQNDGRRIPAAPTAAAARNGDTYVRLQRQHPLTRELESEAAILSKLRHPNITLMYGVVEHPVGCLVSEYVSCGSLFALLHRHMKLLNLYQIVRLGGEIASAIAYVHSRGILHCDLKSSNILLNDIGSAKVCDFGLANSLRNPIDFPRCSNKTGADEEFDHEVKALFLGSIGTLHWMAPEVIRGEPYSKAADIYSFGVILWEMFTRKIPYQDLSPTHVTTLAGYAGIGPHDPTAETLRRALHRQDSPTTDQFGKPNQLLSHINWESVHMEGLEPTPSVMELPELIATVLLDCLKAEPAARPSGLELASFFNGLAKSDVLSVEENLKTFFGL